MAEDAYARHLERRREDGTTVTPAEKLERELDAMFPKYWLDDDKSLWWPFRTRAEYEEAGRKQRDERAYREWCARQEEGS